MQDLREEKILRGFIKNRDFLIDSMEQGLINKQEYVEKSYEYIMDNDLQPFEDDNYSVEKAMLNYQIYNTLAKFSMMGYEDNKFRNPSYAKEMFNTSLDYYELKDKGTMKLVEFIDYKNFKAYFVNLQSKGLRGELFEIVLDNYDRAVFHSMDKRLLYRLRNNGVFDEEIQVSIIDHYVNSKYA
ncbi:MAG: DUF6648 family protein [Acidaminobacteraceae bacterium]